MINQIKLEKNIIDEIASQYNKTTGLNYLFHQSFDFYDGEEKNKHIVIMTDLKELENDGIEELYSAKLDIYVRVPVEIDETFEVITNEVDKILSIVPLLVKDYANGDIGIINFIKSSKDSNDIYRLMQFEYELKLSEHVLIDVNPIPTA